MLESGEVEITSKSTAREILDRIFEEREKTFDVVLVAENEDFIVHESVLLTQSPYFQALFSSGMKEASSFGSKFFIAFQYFSFGLIKKSICHHYARYFKLQNLEPN